MPGRQTADSTQTASAELVVRPLAPDTWDAFAQLVEANNGVWGGCWCMCSHIKLGKGRTAAQNRAEKEQRVHDGRVIASIAR